MSETGVGLSELLDGWEVRTLGEITDIFKGGTPKRNVEKYFQGNIAWAIPTDITKLNGALYLDDTGTHISEEALGKSSARLLPAGTVLLTSRATIGKVAIAKIPVATNQGFANFLCKEEIANVFLAYYLRSITDLLISLGGGTTFLEVTKTTLLNVEIPLPPLPEQHRIVAKVEELFTKLDAGINELHKAQSQLKRYRQSVLKAAFEGKLTEAWRTEHQEELEPASVLLERILKERREKWEAEQLGQMKAKGKTPKDDKWKANYKEPIAPDTSNLPELPNGWKWVKLGQVTYLITKGSSPRWQGFNYVDKGIFFLRSQNVGWGGLNLSNIAYLPEAFNEKEKKSVLQRGDVLLNLVGASIGRAAIASGELEGANMNQAVALIRLVRNGLDNKFLMTYLISPDAQSIIHEKKVDVARANLSLTDVSEFAVPLPPLSEQQAIVSEVESRLSVADEVGKTITVELKRAEQLRQSILKKAFSGKLVPQDPNDKSASILLERIKAEKLQHTQGQLRLKLV